VNREGAKTGYEKWKRGEPKDESGQTAEEVENCQKRVNEELLKMVWGCGFGWDAVHFAVWQHWVFLSKDHRGWFIFGNMA
jgi:hypothetical protein